MRISASNIAWKKEQDEEMYEFLQKNGIEGVEIAPTRLFVENPYNLLESAELYAKSLLKEYNLMIPSMQSIWYGREENMFSSEKEQKILFDYTKKAIDFAHVLSCRNLVFGCPKNRSYTYKDMSPNEISFFRELGNYAYINKTVLSIEANPTIYHTNYCNTTKEALELIQKVGSEGFLLNLDMGTMIQNHEDISVLECCSDSIHHVHISEPYLNVIEKRTIHSELSAFLKEHSYEGFISLEVKTQEDTASIKDMLWYIKEVFT